MQKIGDAPPEVMLQSNPKMIIPSANWRSRSDSYNDSPVRKRDKKERRAQDSVFQKMFTGGTIDHHLNAELRSWMAFEPSKDYINHSIKPSRTHKRCLSTLHNINFITLGILEKRQHVRESMNTRMFSASFL